MDIARKFDEAQKDLAQLKDVVARLQRRAEKQSAVLQAMLDVYGPKLGVSNADLLGHIKDAEVVRESTLSKGCTDCRRPMGPRQAKCLYCGAVRNVEPTTETHRLAPE